MELNQAARKQSVQIAKEQAHKCISMEILWSKHFVKIVMEKVISNKTAFLALELEVNTSRWKKQFKFLKESTQEWI